MRSTRCARAPATTRSVITRNIAGTRARARRDPLRCSPPLTLDPTFSKTLTEPCAAPVGLAAVMRRHMHEFGLRREHFGIIAVNNRTNAQRNPRAVFCGQPLTMANYQAAPVIYDPFTMLDMDVPIDGAMALVVTTAERAADLPGKPVSIEASARLARPDSDMSFQPFETAAAQRRLVLERMWELSGCSPADLDLVNVYDGFSILAVTGLEAIFDAAGDGARQLDDAWDPKAGVLRFLGRIPMSPHGGNLSEGWVQGIGHMVEAVVQLRGPGGGTAGSGGAPGAAGAEQHQPGACRDDPRHVI
jgi:acetyl-CoA acetyltransferase